MKNTIILIVLTTVIALSGNAQSKRGNDFILLNNNWNMNRVNNSYYSSYNGIFHNVNNHNFSLQYVKSIKRNQALRFSLGYQEHHFGGTGTSLLLGDTIFSNYRSSITNIAKLGIGMEWRKMLHNDVMIIGGADVNAGLGTLDQSINEYRQYKDSTGLYHTEGYGSVTQNSGLGIHTSLTPFTGIRVGWGRFAIGYAATLPITLDIARSKLETNTSIDIKFQHSVSVGYRIFNRKKKRE